MSAAIIVLAASILIAAEVATLHLHPDRWGLLLGVPLGAIGVVTWLVAFVTDGRSGRPPSGGA
jgi:hypothetical protein